MWRHYFLWLIHVIYIFIEWRHIRHISLFRVCCTKSLTSYPYRLVHQLNCPDLFFRFLSLSLFLSFVSFIIVFFLVFFYFSCFVCFVFCYVEIILTAVTTYGADYFKKANTKKKQKKNKEMKEKKKREGKKRKRDFVERLNVISTDKITAVRLLQRWPTVPTLLLWEQIEQNLKYRQLGGLSNVIVCLFVFIFR